MRKQRILFSRSRLSWGQIFFMWIAGVLLAAPVVGFMIAAAEEATWLDEQERLAEARIRLATLEARREQEGIPATPEERFVLARARLAAVTPIGHSEVGRDLIPPSGGGGWWALSYAFGLLTVVTLVFLIGRSFYGRSLLEVT